MKRVEGCKNKKLLKLVLLLVSLLLGKGKKWQDKERPNLKRPENK